MGTIYGEARLTNAGVWSVRTLEASLADSCCSTHRVTTRWPGDQSGCGQCRYSNAQSDRQSRGADGRFCGESTTLRLGTDCAIHRRGNIPTKLLDDACGRASVVAIVIGRVERNVSYAIHVPLNALFNLSKQIMVVDVVDFDILAAGVCKEVSRLAASVDHQSGPQIA